MVAMGHVINRNITLVGILISLIIVSMGILFINQRNLQFESKRKEDRRPATIENVVLRIESNIMRVQTAMEDLVYSEYASDLKKKVNAISMLESAISKDFQAMSMYFPKNNSLYLNAYTLFQKWKVIKDEIIRLTMDGPSIPAQNQVRGMSANHAMEIRKALTALDKFSKQRVIDFDSSAVQKR